jgi:multiple sugar transport system substrate-binding protein/sn-glycerol 3-phosphate transport system substrate-binding protein
LEPEPYGDVDPTGARVVFWHNHAREREEGLHQLAEEFNRTNQWEITVLPEFAGGYDDIYERIVAGIAAGDPDLLPNLTIGYANQLATYQLSDTLVDMDELLESSRWGLTEEDWADIHPSILESDVSPIFGDGHYRLAFPAYRSMEVLYYNQSWLQDLGFDGPPATWAEFAEMACAATDPDASRVGYEISTDASRFASMVFSRHASYYAPDGSAFDFENARVKESMTYMQEYFNMGCFALIAELYGDQTDFGNRKTLFAIGSSSGLPYYAQAVESGEEGAFDWGIAPLPFADYGDEPVMNVYGASLAIPRTTPEQELAAWLFVRYFTSPEVNARWAQITNYYPVRWSAVEYMGAYLAENPQYEQGLAYLPFATYEAQWCPCYSDVRDLMDDVYRSILDGADIDGILYEANLAANQLLDESRLE